MEPNVMYNSKPELPKKTVNYYINSVIALLIMFLFQYLPVADPLTPYGMSVIGVFLGVIYAWATVGIIWPALLGLVLLGFTGENTVQGIFQTGFGSDTYLFIFFILIFATIINNSGVSSRIANWVVSRKFSKGKPWLMSTLLLTSAYLVGALVSLTPGIIIPWAILYTLCKVFGYTPKDQYPKLMVIGIVFASAMGQSAFPFKPLALMLMNALNTAQPGSSINYVTFTILAVIIGYGAVLGFVLLCKFVFRPDVTRIKQSDYVFDSDTKLNTYQKQVLALLGVFFILLFLPGILPSELAIVTLLNKIGSTGTVVLLLVFAAFLKRKDNSNYVNMVDTIKNGVPWETMMLMAFALPITGLLTQDATGVKAFINEILTPILGSNNSPLLFVVLIVLLSVVITNFIGNMVVGLMMVPLVAIYATSTGVSPEMLVVGLSVFVNMSLTLPSGSPTAALLHGNTEWVSAKDIYKYAVPTVLFASVIGIFVCWTLGNLLF